MTGKVNYKSMFLGKREIREISAEQRFNKTFIYLFSTLSKLS